MKKLSILLTTLLCAVALNAKTFYLVPNDNWKQASAKFSIYYFGGEGITASFTDFMTSTDGIHYETTVPDAATTIIFVRHNPSATSPAWDANKWNQTKNITVPTDGNNCFTMAADVWDEPNGTWSTYTPSTILPTYYIAGNANVVGTSVNEWAPDAIELGEATADKSATYTFTTLPADTCRLKVTNGTWDLSFGYAALDKTNSSDNILTDENTNIVFVPKAVNTEVKLTFDGTNIILTGDFASATPVKTVTAYYVNTTAWENVYAFVFAGLNNNTWPGVAMTKTEFTKNDFAVYSCDFAETYTNIRFNNDTGGNQTDDLTFDATKPYYYDGTWYTSLDEIPDICVPEYGIMVGEEFKAFTANTEKEGEYMLTGVSLKNGTTFTLYDSCNKATWTVTPKEGSTEKVTIADEKYVAGADGYYDFYYTPSTAGDALYIGYTGTTPTSVVTVTTLDRNAPMYNILGQQVDATYRGVVFQNGTKFLLQ